MSETQFTKVCEACNTEKDIRQFSWVNKAGTGVRRRVCRQCWNEKLRNTQPRPVMTGTRTCTVCKIEKPVAQFCQTKKGAGYRHSQCRECTLERAKRYRKTDRYKELRERNRGKESREMRARHLVHRYGITEAEYQEILKSQGGVCCLCGANHPGGRKKTFAVDHDHQTKRVRGLLCWKCNVGLGKLGDTVESLERAVEYLRGLPTLNLAG